MVWAYYIIMCNDDFDFEYESNGGVKVMWRSKNRWRIDR